MTEHNPQNKQVDQAFDQVRQTQAGRTNVWRLRPLVLVLACAICLVLVLGIYGLYAYRQLRITEVQDRRIIQLNTIAFVPPQSDTIAQIKAAPLIHTGCKN